MRCQILRSGLTAARWRLKSISDGIEREWKPASTSGCGFLTMLAAICQPADANIPRRSLSRTIKGLDPVGPETALPRLGPWKPPPMNFTRKKLPQKSFPESPQPQRLLPAAAPARNRPDYPPETPQKKPPRNFPKKMGSIP